MRSLKRAASDAFDFIICKDTDHAQIEFERRQEHELIEHHKIYVASPEDVILKKLVFYRDGASEKHIRDIRGILADQELDLHYLNAWITKLRVQTEWAKVSS